MKELIRTGDAERMKKDEEVTAMKELFKVSDAEANTATRQLGDKERELGFLKEKHVHL